MRKLTKIKRPNLYKKRERRWGGVLGRWRRGGSGSSNTGGAASGKWRRGQMAGTAGVGVDLDRRKREERKRK